MPSVRHIVVVLSDLLVACRLSLPHLFYKSMRLADHRNKKISKSMRKLDSATRTMAAFERLNVLEGDHIFQKKDDPHSD